MGEFTKGPWFVGLIEKGDKEIIIGGPEGDPGIVIDFDDVDQNTQIANANLVAASPEAYEIIKLLASHMGHCNTISFSTLMIDDSTLRQAVEKYMDKVHQV